MSVLILFSNSCCLDKIKQVIKEKQVKKCLIVEHPVFFGSNGSGSGLKQNKVDEIKYNKKKILLFRASMKHLENELSKMKSLNVEYIDYMNYKDYKDYKDYKKYKNVITFDPTDKTLEAEIKSLGLELELLESPLFITPKSKLREYNQNGNVRIHNSFYIRQRKEYKVLLNKQGKAEGGKWSYDIENRERMPENVYKSKVKDVKPVKLDETLKEAIEYTEKNFSDYYGNIDNFVYPYTQKQAKKLFNDFLKHKLNHFGEYQDSIYIDTGSRGGNGNKNKNKKFALFHSMISSSLNIGLITPEYVIKKVESSNTSMNNKEGFIRQVLGWREFCRYYYYEKSSKSKIGFFFSKNKNKLDQSFYYPNEKSTGIKVLDYTIQKAFDTAYLHHIERLMVMGNLMLLYKIHPNEMYRWFMEFAIDSYDWVMDFNIYEMICFGKSNETVSKKITTKPYITTSNYYLKMSNESVNKKYDPEGFEKWDTMYRNFVSTYRQNLLKIPRMKMILKNSS